MFGFSWGDLASIATVVSTVLTALAALAAAIAFVPAQVQRSRELASAKYQTASDAWREFVSVAATYPEYRLVEVNPERWPPDDGGDDARREALLQMLTGVFETAFLAYRHAGTATRKREYEGWVATLSDDCRRPDYQGWRRRIAAWGEAPGFSGYELTFERRILAELAKHGKSATSLGPSVS